MTDKERRDVIEAIRQVVRLYECADELTAKADEILKDIGIMPAYSFHRSPTTGHMEIHCVRGFDELADRLGVSTGPRKWYGEKIDDGYSEFDMDGTTVFKLNLKEDDDE